MGKTIYQLVVAGLLVLFAFPASAFAQATIGSALIRGTVQDSSQAAVPKVTVMPPMKPPTFPRELPPMTRGGMSSKSFNRAATP